MIVNKLNVFSIGFDFQQFVADNKSFYIFAVVSYRK